MGVALLTARYKSQKKENNVFFFARNSMQVSGFFKFLMIIENNIDLLFNDITNTKDLAWLYIDDRCLKFEGDYSSLKEQINVFKPCYKF